MQQNLKRNATIVFMLSWVSWHGRLRAV